MTDLGAPDHEGEQRGQDPARDQAGGAGERAAPQRAVLCDGGGDGLGEEEVTSAIATSACANPMVTAQAGQSEAPRRRTEESSRSWRCDNRRHTTYWVRRWPPLGGSSGVGLPQLVAQLTAVPALATTFSLTLARGDRQDVSVTGHVRITGRSSSELATSRRDLERCARQMRTGLARLDREQLPGVLATLPLGGAR